MTTIVALQGGMAVGKTAASKFIEAQLPNVHVSYENPYPVVKEIKSRKLVKTNFDDFIEIQRMFINAEIERWRSFLKYEFVVTDFGAEEIEYHTLFYHKAMGYNWDVEAELKEELKALRKCKIDKILFLEASDDQLRNNKESDLSRNREYFEFYLNNFLRGKKEWLLSRFPVEIVNCKGLSLLQQNEKVFKLVQSHYISSKRGHRFSVVE